jgi:thiol:disulfide interchange protein
MLGFQARLVRRPVSRASPLQLDRRRRRPNNRGEMNQAQRPLWVIFAALVLVVGYSAYSRWTRKPEIVEWVEDLDAAKAESRKTGRPIFAYFTADWCPPCQEMKGTTFADPEVKRALEAYVRLKIDADRQPSVVTNHGVSGFPTFLILDASGAIHDGRDSFLSASQMTAWLTGRPPPPAVTQPATQPR